MSRHAGGSSAPTADSPTTPAGGSEKIVAPSGREWATLGILATGLGMIVLDGTIVGVALPDIIKDLKMDLTDAQWVNSLYAVLLAALLLSSGNLADRWGRRRLFQTGLIIFVGGSMLAAAGATTGTLLAARAVQAVGAACIMPSTLSTVNAIFRGKYRAAAFGVWGAVISGAAAIGPLIGGALTQYASWRWIFWVNVPIGVILFVLTYLVVPETRGVTKSGADLVGVGLSAVGLGALVFSIIEGPTLGWWTPIGELKLAGLTWGKDAPISPIPVTLTVAVIALAGFLLWEHHRGKVGRPAVLELGLFRLPTFSWGNLTAAMVAVGEFAILFVLPLFLVNARGFDVMDSGFVLAGMAAGAFLSGAAARHLAAKLGSPGTVILGLSLEVIGIVVLALILTPTLNGWIIAAPLVLYGLGLGLASAQLTGTVLQDVPVEVSGEGSATQSTVRQIGSAFGTAFAGGALSITVALAVPRALEKVGISSEKASQLADTTRLTGGTNLTQMRAKGAESATLEALAHGFTDATTWALLTGAVFLVLGLIGAINLTLAARRH